MLPNAPTTARGMLNNVLRNLTIDGGPRITAESAHALKQGVDDMIDTAKRSGNRQAARFMMGVKEKVVGEIEKAAPGYKKALEAYAGESALIRAMENGTQFSTKKGAELLDDFQDMTAGERDMFRLGAMRSLQAILDSNPDGRNVVRQIFGNRTKRTILEKLFPDKRSFDLFRLRMGTESATRQSDQVIRGGSPTARIQAEQRAEGAEILEGALDVATSGGGWSLATTFLRRLISNPQELPPEVAREIATLLSNPDPLKVRSALYLAGQRAKGQTKKTAQNFMRVLGPAVGAGAVQGLTSEGRPR